MFCRNCGGQIPHTALYCRYCGTKILPVIPDSSFPSRLENVIFPEQAFFNNQDTNKSVVTDKGIYDLTRFSENEDRTIVGVITYVNQKYPPQIRSVGFYNEAYTIIYKARHVLMNLIYEKYQDTGERVNTFAAACAASTQGAYRRAEAIRLFEVSGGIIPSEARLMSSFDPLMIYNKFAELYDQEHLYDKAIYYTQVAFRYANLVFDDVPPYYEERIHTLEDKREKKIIRRPNKPSKAVLSFYSQLATATDHYLPLISDI